MSVPSEGAFGIPPGLVPLVTALVSVAGLMWGVYQYSAEQKKNRQTAEREFMKPWLENQRAIYSEALNAAAMAANSHDAPERMRAEQTFWQLYHGRMVLVETRQVSGGMVRFGQCLSEGTLCGTETRNERVRGLATAMAESMAATAKMTYEEFAGNQFRYGSGAN